MTTVQPPKFEESVANSSPPRETPAHLDELHAPPERGSSKSPLRWLGLLLFLVAAGAGGWAAYHFNLIGTKSDAPAKATSRPVPVVAAKVTRGDVNLYLSGLLGTVTAFQTATVRTRVAVLFAGIFVVSIRRPDSEITIDRDSETPFLAVIASVSGCFRTINPKSSGVFPSSRISRI
jgi:hypothetical protein